MMFDKKAEVKRVVDRLAALEDLVWINPNKIEYGEFEKELPIADSELDEAEARLLRFAPFIKAVFEDTVASDGVIESPLTEIPNMKQALEAEYGTEIPGKLFLKLDSHLPVAGSIKARGGVYEVLKHAEDLALEAGLLKVTDDYSCLATPKFRDFFSQFTVQVGSTGNLGLSIGITSAALGFKVVVHMSADAKQWKKDMLRSKGVTVVEYADDYGKAVEQGRKESDADPKSYFVDDEKSLNLFLGYTVAARRTKAQLDAAGIVIDSEHPLFVYIPCGVGGAPGGVAYGFKRIFKDNAHVFFVEPTLSPCVALGMATGLEEKICVHDIGIEGITHADGLAVARPSGLVCRLMKPQLSGVFTLSDYKLYDYLRLLDKTEGIRIEPSSCAAFEAPVMVLQYPESRRYVLETVGENIKNAVQICWATGGRMVPEEDMKRFLNTRL